MIPFFVYFMRLLNDQFQPHSICLPFQSLIFTSMFHCLRVHSSATFSPSKPSYHHPLPSSRHHNSLPTHLPFTIIPLPSQSSPQCHIPLLPLLPPPSTLHLYSTPLPWAPSLAGNIASPAHYAKSGRCRDPSKASATHLTLCHQGYVPPTRLSWHDDTRTKLIAVLLRSMAGGLEMVVLLCSVG